MPRKVVLVACGSFNPITNMHLRMFELARDHLRSTCNYDVTEGIISPVSDAYSKRGLVSAQHRCAMVNIAVLTSDWIRLDAWESSQGKWTETKAVLQHHQDALSGETDQKRVKRRRTENNINECPAQVMLLCGADLIQSFNVPGLWKDCDIEYILSNFGIVVISRAGTDVSRLIYESDVLSHYRNNIHVITEWITNEISSTKIRRALQRNESVKYLLQDGVIAYIKDHGLYQESAAINNNNNSADEDEDSEGTAV
ncbi:nicotinamide/nicotinic acid mononucleotide adenylyltransferase 1-like isoform X2 [Ornithodoros turicata]|uniref:nicotinamide/nicotinic acid mononucleotide adenylyltransferase 1-like isoform X2 n=1 Tax=Ornithodoros turicata TaxID=34597 RepID=UPI003139596B